MILGEGFRNKDSVTLLVLMSSLAGIAFMIITSPCYINAATNNTSNSVNKNSTITATINKLITNILAKNLENHLQKAGAILEITSKLPQVDNTSFAHLLNTTLTTLNGLPQNADIPKRQVAQNILSTYKDIFEIAFIMPNGDVYLSEPYSVQEALTTNNLAFRDYFQGAVKTHNTYLGNVITSATSGVREALIAVPIYSQKNNSSLIGVWAGGIDFNTLNKELQSLNLTSLNGNTRAVYLDDNGLKIADSDITKSKTPESFANLNSFKNAINGKTGSTIDTVNNKKMLVTYQPVKVFQNTYAVLFTQPAASNTAT